MLFAAQGLEEPGAAAVHRRLSALRQRWTLFDDDPPLGLRWVRSPRDCLVVLPPRVASPPRGFAGLALLGAWSSPPRGRLRYRSFTGFPPSLGLPGCSPLRHAFPHRVSLGQPPRPAWSFAPLWVLPPPRVFAGWTLPLSCLVVRPPGVSSLSPSGFRRVPPILGDIWSFAPPRLALHTGPLGWN